MRIDLPACAFTPCKYYFDGNCMEKSEYERCDYRRLHDAEQDRPDPQPLTLEELRQMDGEPVYVVTLDNPLENQPYWAIAGINSNDSRYQNGVALYNRVQGDWGAFDLYGDTWLAYRAKPERSEGE